MTLLSRCTGNVPSALHRAQSDVALRVGLTAMKLLAVKQAMYRALPELGAPSRAGLLHLSHVGAAPRLAGAQAVEGTLVSAISFVKTLASTHQHELDLLRSQVRAWLSSPSATHAPCCRGFKGASPVAGRRWDGPQYPWLARMLGFPETCRPCRPNGPPEPVECLCQVQ